MKEREFQAWVVDVATRLGWRVWHVPTPMRPIGQSKFVPDPRGRGLADLIMFRESPPKLIFAECKTETGNLSDEQREFLRLARCVAAKAITFEEPSLVGSFPIPNFGKPVGVYLWRPGMEDLIETILKGGQHEEANES